ncbi:hypothetical protein KQX54_012181 [Cotesia glomerata]|uniref:Uncharacterized protein n=1 Tax=Cotesia glomerata TaxID=32391 RepID=A0AAV7IF14_COTGL|nr:hypothetical protein KQX54_012181 [Cotesia glomerata]
MSCMEELVEKFTYDEEIEEWVVGDNTALTEFDKAKVKFVVGNHLRILRSPLVHPKLVTEFSIRHLSDITKTEAITKKIKLPLNFAGVVSKRQSVNMTVKVRWDQPQNNRPLITKKVV